MFKDRSLSVTAPVTALRKTVFYLVELTIETGVTKAGA